MRKSFWHHVPIVRLLLPFAVGIGMSMFWAVPIAACVSLLCLALLFLAYAFFAFKTFNLRWVFGIAANLFLLSFGITLYQVRNKIPAHHFSNLKYDTVYVVIDAPLVQKQAAFKTTGHVIGLTAEQKSKAATGNILIYVDANAPIDQLTYGNVLAIPAYSIRNVKAPLNPDEFNYQRYLAFKQIYHQAYVSANGVRLGTAFYGSPVLKSIFELQGFLKQTLQQHLGSQHEVGVAQALLYGDDDGIPQETMQAYANTGTLHVLAVSGMHVGLIFGVLMLFTSGIATTGKSKKIKLLVICVFLWLYSLVCGFSPSILRATVMFSFVIAGQIFENKSSSYNTLAASALVLLAANCNMLANVGFQLSYLAVLGIIFFQPLIQQWLAPTSWVGKQVWSITAVSIAAQLITFPIGLLYFHQFPNCFLFSNLLIIPLTTFILYGIMVLVTFSWWPMVASFLGVVLTWLIHFTNMLVSWVETIPYAYVGGLHIGIGESIIWYVLIGAATFWFWKRNKAGLWFAVLASILLCSIQLTKRVNQWNQERMVVFAVGKRTCIEYIKGRTSVNWINNQIDSSLMAISFHVKQHHWKSGIKQTTVYVLDSNWKYISIGNTSWVITRNTVPKNQLSATYALVTEPLPAKALAKLSVDTFIVNGTYSPKTLAEFKKAVYPIAVYSLQEQGAWQWFAPK